MRVLVTGGAGFIGSHIVDALAERGHEPVVLDALLARAHGEGAGAPPGVVRADVRDADAVRALLRGVDAVCHQAALVGLGKDFADAPDYVGCNDLGTAVLLAAMAEAGTAALVLAGSMVVYGGGATTAPRTAPSGPARAPSGTCGKAASNRRAPAAAPHCCPGSSARTRPPTRATCTPPPN